MKILFDFDDVLNDLSSVWVKELNRHVATAVTYEDITAYNLRESYPETAPSEIFEPYLDGTLYLDAHPVQAAQELVRKLAAENDVYICTSNLFGVEDETLYDYLFHADGPTLSIDRLLQFVKEYYPEIDKDHIIVTANKSMVNGDVLIDDNPAHLTTFRGVRILMDKPYNRDLDCERYNIFRAKSYDDVFDIILRECVR